MTSEPPSSRASRLSEILRGLAVDAAPLRVSRDFRRIWAGLLFSELGYQFTLVATFVQVKRLTGSAAAVGLIGLFGLVALVVGSVAGGAVLDHYDRRKLLIAAQLGFMVSGGILLAGAIARHPPLWLIYGAVALSAGVSAIDSPTRSAMTPRLVGTELLPSALALNQVIWNGTGLVGPALAGIVISRFDLPIAYGIDLASYVAMLVVAVGIRPMAPEGTQTGTAGWAAVKEGFAFLRGRRVLQSTFVIDLVAMVFGMPRALFAFLAATQFHGSDAVVGLLFSAPAVGALIAALTSGWVGRVRHQGRAVIWAVVLWGAGITAFGLIGDHLWLALSFLAFAGAADVISAVFRSTILQLSVPDSLRGRLSGIHILVVTGGPRLGDLEAGLVAAAFSPTVSVVSGGLLCIVGAAVLAVWVPELRRYHAATRPDYAPRMSGSVRTVELRVLDGPNVYFPRPAIKLTLAVSGWLELSDQRLVTITGRLGSGAAKPGRAGSEHRRRFVARFASGVTRRLADAAGVRLAVRARPGPEHDQIVVAFPWRRRGSAEVLGRETALLLGALLSSRRSPGRLIDEAAARIRAVDPGAEPGVPDPSIPVISVTGTNGKTTTVRLLAHIARCAGKRVAYSSTDGVYRDDGDLVEEGDYSGFGGAAMALAQCPDIAVLETARGGILLRGIGVLHNDSAVVTNVSEDHLGLHGIWTLDQLSEVKASVTRITRPDGWVVLNADDPRVLGMRRSASGRPWLCSLDADHPALRDALDDGGRAMTALDGWMIWLEGQAAHPIVELVDVPVTIAGISRSNAMNAMQAAAAALAVGLSKQAVVKGLTTFVLDPERNPGRANLFSLDGRIVVIDYAHNEAGMAGLTELCDGLRRRGREVWLAICTAGDRTDKILHDFAYRAARGADHVTVAELLRYLRGREREDIVERLRAGAVDGGAKEVDVFADELSALRSMSERARRGDVVAVTALGMRSEIFAWLEERGAAGLTPSRVRRLVTAVRASRSTVAVAG